MEPEMYNGQMDVYSDHMGMAAYGAIMFPIIFLFLISIIFAIGIYFLAKKMGKNRVVWVILALIPVVNYFFILYVSFQFAYYLLDSLNELKART